MALAKTDHDQRVCIYPNYINSKKTVAEGRRIPASLCQAHPHPIEIYESVVKGLQLPADLEDKAYSRDWLLRGRIRVQLKKDDGSLIRPDIPNKRTLLIKVSEFVARHPNRTNPRPAAAAGSGASGATAGGAGPSKAASGKKGGKKKK